MKLVLTQVLSLFLCLSFVTFNSACTKEKAEALKTAAKDFRTQASVAIHKLDKLFIEDVAFASLSNEDSLAKIVDSLKNGPSGRRGIEQIVYESEARALDTSKYSQKLNQIRDTYEEFEGMFDDLPRGHYFAGDAVAKSENLARKLVAQMIFLANYIKTNPFRLNARLQRAVDRRRDALAETDVVKRENKLILLATEIKAIRTDTQAANAAAILECLKGAEIGIRVVHLIQTYKTSSVTDILAIVRDGLGRVNQLTGKNTDALMKRVEEINTTISADADWNAILARVITEMNG
ncbi:MAG: hypothetical protein ABIO91_01465 [Pyrinomonadaceae bacterium]